MLARQLAAFATLIVAISLSGCAAQATAGAPASAHGDAAVPAPTATLPPAPASQFPAPCSQLVTDDAVRAIGGDFTIPAPVFDRPAGVLASDEQSGSMRCTWAFASDGRSHELDLYLRRHAAAVAPTMAGGGAGYPGGQSVDIGADMTSQICDGNGSTAVCQILFQVGDYLLVAWTSGVKPTSAQLGTDLDAALRPLVARLKSAPVPATWTRPSATRAFGLDCANLASTSGLAAAVGWSSASAGNQYNQPSDISLGGGKECMWLPPDNEQSGLPGLLIADMVSGGAWIWPRFSALAGVESISLPGADHAAVLCDGSPGSCQVVATMGPDLVSIVQSSDMRTGSGAELAAALQRGARALLPVLATTP